MQKYIIKWIWTEFISQEKQKWTTKFIILNVIPANSRIEIWFCARKYLPRFVIKLN